MKGWAARQVRRRNATSGRSCSLARSVFFIRQSQPINRGPDRAIAEMDAVLAGKPRLRRRQRDVVMRFHIGGESSLLFRRQLSRPMAAARTRHHRSCLPTPDQCFVDVGNADPKQQSRSSSRHAAVNGGKHPRPKIRRIALTRTPRHHHPPQHVVAQGRESYFRQRGNPLPIPANPGML